KRFN
ncbi:hypothetical protein ACTFIY_000042, partial [Dictyostelium cf. discoideum]